MYFRFDLKIEHRTVLKILFPWVNNAVKKLNGAILTLFDEVTKSIPVLDSENISTYVH